MNIKYMTKASLIAAIYIVLVLIQILPFPLATLTFGPIQLRLAEGLVLLLRIWLDRYNRWKFGNFNCSNNYF